MEESKYNCCDFRVGLKTEPTPKRPNIVERLVNHRKADDCINYVAIYPTLKYTPRNIVVEWPTANSVIHKAMGFIRYRKKITPSKNRIWSYPVAMCFAPQIHKMDDIYARYLLNVALVALGHSMGVHLTCAPERQEKRRYEKE